MKVELQAAPTDEKTFLEDLMGKGYCLPAQYGLALQQHIILTYASSAGDIRHLQCIVVGRTFEGHSREPSKLRLKLVKSQHVAVRDMLALLP